MPPTIHCPHKSVRLERLANRIGDIKPTRMPFTAVFRWPMEAERERVEAEHDLRIGSNVNPVVDAPLAHVLIRGAVTTIPTTLH